jgi:GNAT superfamily N-acetyltransferase
MRAYSDVRLTLMRTTTVFAGAKFRPATAANWPHLETLFGERGACGGCWCMAWRFPPAQWRAQKGTENKKALRRLVSIDPAPGIIGFLRREPIGWCAVAPRNSYPFLERSKVLAPVDDSPVWSISCLFVAKHQRKKGLTPLLLTEAVSFAAKHGAGMVEGYPTEPFSKHAPDPFLWTGTVSAFRAAGFSEVARRSKTRPIMRYFCG